MRAQTRATLALLQKYETANLTTGKSRIDGRGKGVKLYVNVKTAYSLERRGYATFNEDSNGVSTLAITDTGKESFALEGKQ